ncbi:MAG: transcriptional repressor [Bacilli bacterium]|nr:transcriptional repressor [Bacilli bacterium]
MSEILKNKELKNTKARSLILDVLKGAKVPLSADEIYDKVRNKGLNLSTVYRTLNTFFDNGIVNKEVNPQKENVFSLIKEDHEDHHVLICTKCHKIVPLKGCPYHEVNEKIEDETGFKIQDHNIEIYGVCPDCKDK